MSPAPAVTQPPAVVLRNTARRGSYLEQLLAEHTPAFPAPAAPCPPPVGTARGQRHRPVERPPALMPSPDVRNTDGATAAPAVALTQARSRPRIDDDTETAPAADATTMGIAECVAACTGTAPPPLPRDPMDWAAFGTVIPVLAGHTGGGASVLAAVLAGALAARGHQVLLIDAADPLRSGLADATTDDGPSRPSPHGSVRVRQARRGPICCARLEFDDIPVRSPALVPAPQYWASPDGPVDVTIIDIGWDAWALGATALQGPGGWLRCGSPTPRPVLAMRPSLPAARHTEQLLNRLAHWDHDGGAADIAAVAVIGAKKVPPALRAAAGDALTPLLASAVCLPDDRRLAERGITADPTPAAAQHAVQPLLTRWGLLLTTTAAPPVPRRSLLRRQPLPQEGLTS